MSLTLLKQSTKINSPKIHKLSKIFQPVTISPKNAQIKNEELLSKSQKLMLELGIIKQANPGSFYFLPLGIKALKKLTKLIDNEMDKIGAQKVIFPTLTNSKLWKATGRFESIGSELFTLQDRHKTTYVLSPTHEESASDLLAAVAPLTYKQFPLKLYQITNKYRDEMKPRFGLMRSRQFIMKDLYTFDIDQRTAQISYEEVCNSYNSIFDQIGIKYVKVLGSTGNMGGSISHEYHYPAEIGEDNILLCMNCNYAANVELSGTKKCPNCKTSENLKISPGIEIGHTFFLGEKYSKPLKATYLAINSKPTNLQMGSYGLGLTRILAAAVEVLSLEQEMRWPDILAPYSAIIISPKQGSKEEALTEGLTEKILNGFNSISFFDDNVLLDDRNHLTIGKRVFDAKRVGYRFIIVIGSKATENPPVYELIDLKLNNQNFFSENELFNCIKSEINKL